MNKYYNEQFNIGKAKYVVNFHDGVNTHNDGSPFYDIKIFRNARAQRVFVNRLITAGYQKRNR